MNKSPKVVQLGNKVIRAKAKKVYNVHGPEVKRITNVLISSMQEQNLVGLAAPQIGEGVRIFVSEVRSTTCRKNIAEPDELRIFVNPEIITHSKRKSVSYEGCGSVAEAGLFGPVSRYERITVKALNIDGESFTLEASGLLARIIQHEIDHLDGTVFLDRVTDTRKLMGRQEYIDSQKKRRVVIFFPCHESSGKGFDEVKKRKRAIDNLYYSSNDRLIFPHLLFSFRSCMLLVSILSVLVIGLFLATVFLGKELLKKFVFTRDFARSSNQLVTWKYLADRLHYEVLK